MLFFTELHAREIAMYVKYTIKRICLSFPRREHCLQMYRLDQIQNHRMVHCGLWLAQVEVLFSFSQVEEQKVGG